MSLKFSKNLIEYSLVPERRRPQGRKDSYSNRVHFVSEVSRREQRKQRKAEQKQGLNPHAAEDSGENPNPTDMEPGKDHPLG